MRCLRCIPGIVLSCLLSFFLGAAEPAAPAQWSTTTFQAPEWLRWWLTGSREGESFTPPFDQTDEKQWREHIQKATTALSTYFEKLGMKLPPGTAFAMDPETWTFAMRTRAEEAALIRTYAAELVKRQPKHYVFPLYVIQASRADLEATLHTTFTKCDVTKALDHLLELAAQGRVKILQAVRVESNDGKGATVEVGERHGVAESFKKDPQDRVEWKRSFQTAGLRFEVTPKVIPSNGWTILTMSLEYHFARPTERTIESGDAGFAPGMKIPLTDCHRAKLSTMMWFYNGMTRLLGVWKPEGMSDSSKDDVLQAAFVQMEATSITPAPNQTLAKMLDQYSDKAIPRPTAIEESPSQPMELRTYEVPSEMIESNFSTLGVLPPPIGSDDPFTAPGPPRKLTKAQDYIRSTGIDFPEGSSAALDPITQRMIVVSTPENLAKIDTFFESVFICRLYSPGIQSTLHVFEADAPTILKLAKDHSRLSDQVAALRQIHALTSQGKARLVGVQQVEGIGGQSSVIESGTDQRHLAKIAQPNTTGYIPIETTGELAGTRLTIHGFFGMDRMHFELSPVLEHRSAAMNAPLAKYESHLEMLPGGTRILGLWKTESADGKDVMQIAFLTVDQVPMDAREAMDREDAK